MTNREIIKMIKRNINMAIAFSGKKKYEIAKELGISPGYFSKIMTGYRPIKVITLLKLFDITGFYPDFSKKY